MARRAAGCYIPAMSIEAGRSPEVPAEKSAAITVYAVLGALLLLFAALALWIAFGGEVFARMGASVWALCF